MRARNDTPYFFLIARERDAQDAKWGPQDHDDTVWVTVLSEKVGEVAQEVLKARSGGLGWDQRSELVQVAAVAVAWLQALERREGVE